MPPTLAEGKICDLEIPASDAPRSTDFYQKVFGELTARFKDPVAM